MPDRPAFSALRHRDFRLLFLGQWISITGSQMQWVAVNWHVWLLTHSPTALGLVGLSRVVPIIIFSLLGGLTADARDRRRVMLVTQSLMLLFSASLAGLAFFHVKAAWPIFVLTACAGAAVAFDLPSRQALVPRLVPAEDLPGALSLNITLFQAATIGGPVIAGWLIAAHGVGIVYAADAASFLAVLAALLAMRTSGKAEGKPGSSPWRDLKEGLSFVRRSKLIVATMTLDFAATFFASAMALLPIFADRILRVGPRGLGVLYASPAVGAIVAGLVMSSIRPPGRQGRVILSAVLAYGMATILFGFSRVFLLSCGALALSGAADTVSTVLRQTLRQLVTPDEMRGRMTSINMIFFMGGPQLGEFEAGVVAGWLSAPVSVVLGGAACVAVVMVVTWVSPALRAYQQS